MASILDNVSAELFLWITQYLNSRDLGSLRLVNRSFASKAIVGSFYHAIRARKIQLTRRSLERFYGVISSGSQLGRFVEEVTLVVIVCDTSTLENILRAGWIPRDVDLIDYDDPESGSIIVLGNEELGQFKKSIDEATEQAEQMQQDRELIGQLLCRIFSLVKKQAGVLHHLSLQVAVLEDSREPLKMPRDASRNARHPVLEAAARLFSSAMSSLQDLPIIALDIFNAIPESLLCSVPCDLLAQTSLSPQKLLRSLSISISDTLSASGTNVENDVNDTDTNRPLAKISRDEIFTGLSHLLEACPVLEELRISLYTTPDRPTAVLRQALSLIPRHMHELAKNVFHPRLRKLSLSGLVVDCHDLVAYLVKHRATLQSLELRYFKISQGTGKLTEVMECLQGFALLSSISLNSIYSEGSLCLFPGEKAQAHTTISGSYLGRDAILRTGDDVRKPLEYYDARRARGPVLDTPRTRAAYQLRRFEFGHW